MIGFTAEKKLLTEFKIPVLVITNSIWNAERGNNVYLHRQVLPRSTASVKHLEQHPGTTAPSSNCWHCKGPGEKPGIPSYFFCQGFQLQYLDQNLQFKQPRWNLRTRIAGSIPE